MGFLMPVYKFRRIEDMPGDRWLTPGDPAIVRSIRRVWSTASLIGPIDIPCGVHKYRSIDEMSAAREASEDRRIARIREMRRRK
jgi:hypothetical protein